MSLAPSNQNEASPGMFGIICLSERNKLKQFLIYWAKGLDNLADYHTKHHPPIHHKKVRGNYILHGHLLTSKGDLNKSHNNGRTELRARVCLDPTACSARRAVPTKPQRPNNIDSRYIPNGSEYNGLIKLLS